MKTLIVEDDFIGRKVLRETLETYGSCDFAVDGEEAVMAFRIAWEERRPYDVILMDILMPKTSGLEAVRIIRDMEKRMGVPGESEVKIIMITCLGDPKTVFGAYYKSGATSYIIKPFNRQFLLRELQNFGLIANCRESCR